MAVNLDTNDKTKTLYKCYEKKCTTLRSERILHDTFIPPDREKISNVTLLALLFPI